MLRLINRKLFGMILLFSVGLLFVAGCGGGPIEEDPSDGGEETGDPRIGGVFVNYLGADPSTLHPVRADQSSALAPFGATLVTKDPATGEIVPYLAESWEVAEDGLSITFTLKEGITFHDGTPLTAQDYAWTFNLAFDPDTVAPVIPTTLDGVTSIEATDERTLVFTLSEPKYTVLDNLTLEGFMQPMSQAYVEENGEDYVARNPMGVGPYIFREWSTGEKIVYERNPAFNWQPEFASPPLIDAIEFRVIADEATVLASLEAEELFIATVPESQIDPFTDPEKWVIYELMAQSLYPALGFNLDVEPWDDVKARQALSYAVNRQSIVDILLSGKGEPAYGPLPPSIQGYNPRVEEYYNYDPEMALALFEEIGYTMGDSGWLERDGQPLAFTVLTPPFQSVVVGLEVIKEQLRELGIDMTIEQTDPSLIDRASASGDFEIIITGYNFATADALNFFFDSAMLGTGLNVNANDPQLDEMLREMSRTLDFDRRQELLNDIQIYIVEKAYWLPTVNTISNLVVSTRIQDAVWSEALNTVSLDNAWLIDN